MCIVYVYLSSIASIMKQSHHVYSVSDRLSLAVNPVYLRKSREKNCEKKKVLNHCSSILIENHTILERETNAICTRKFHEHDFYPR